MRYARPLTTFTLALLCACGAAHSPKAADARVTKPLLKVSGRIQSIDGREITLRSGQRLDTSRMPYDPVDQHGYPQLHAGDLIEAAGTLSKPALAPIQITVVWLREIYKTGQR